MAFIAHDDKTEESIIIFGDIDVNSALEQRNDYEVIPNEGFVYVEQKQNSVEMEVKSVEMHHLTARSANSEKENFERIEIEMQSAFEEEADESEWLHPSSMSKRGGRKGCDFHLIDIAKSDEKLCGISEGTNKIPWLKGGQEVNPWLRHAQSNSLTVQTVAKEKVPMLDYPILVEDRCIGDNVFTKAQKRNSSQANLSFNGNGASANVSHMNSIFHSSNSKFLRIDMENMSNSVYSLNSALDSMVLDSYIEYADPVHTNIDHLNRIFNTPHSEYLAERGIRKDRFVTTETYIKMTPAVDQIRILEKQPDMMFLRGTGKNKTLDPELYVWLRGSSNTSCAS